MGEASKKSRSKAAVLAGEARCIYCPEPNADRSSLTLEHMPPIMMFKDRQRASGMEFACCEACNVGSKGADIAASAMAFISPMDDPSDWKPSALERIKPALDIFAPGFRDELSFAAGPRRWLWTPRGLLEPSVTIQANGPIFEAHMTTFSAKLAMALFREHTGLPLPLDGATYTSHFLNMGLAQQTASAMLRIMPAHEQLRQGTRTSAGQFEYRFNSDDRSIVAALASFHHNFHVLAFATSDPETYRMIGELPRMQMTKPGSLLSRLKAL